MVSVVEGMGSRALCRMDLGVYMRFLLRPLLTSVCRIHVILWSTHSIDHGSCEPRFLDGGPYAAVFKIIWGFFGVS